MKEAVVVSVQQTSIEYFVERESSRDNRFATLANKILVRLHDATVD